MKQQIQPYSKKALATPCTTWHVVDEPICPIQRHRPSDVIKVNIQQQKGHISMKLNHLLILIVVVGTMLGVAMFGAINHMIDATPFIQQTAQAQAEWAGRVAIAQAESPFYAAVSMFNGAAMFGAILLAVVTVIGGALWWKTSDR